jgi:RNA polymerase sigma-70 factor, ECF subfamily
MLEWTSSVARERTGGQQTVARLLEVSRSQAPGVGATEVDDREDRLLERLRRGGSRVDWERFVELYSPLLEHWARRLCRAAEAADLVQEVLIVVMQKLQSFAGGGDRSFLAWLRAVMRNRRRDLGRRSAARPCAADSAAIEAVGQENDIDELVETESRNLLIRRAMQIMQSDFEPTTWKACWERVAADRPAADVAAELGISVDVVYAASYRVIRRLRADLAGMWS